MAYNLPPVIKQRYFDSNGNPLAGGKIYTYAAGTTTPQSTYVSISGAANANPIILDANGEASMWLDPSLSYKFVLKDSSDVTQWTVDNVVGLATANAIPTAALQDGSVTTAKLASLAVTAAKLSSDATVDANRAVGTNHIQDSAVTAAKVLDGAITRNKIGAGAVGKETWSSALTTTGTYPDTTDVQPVTATGGSWTLTLPTNTSGRTITIKRTDDNPANKITLGTIDGATRKMTTKNESYTLRGDGTNWYVTSHLASTPWTAYTPTVSFSITTNTANKQGMWRRVGDTAFIQVAWTHNGISNGSLSISLPTGIVIDTAKIPSFSSLTTNPIYLGIGGAYSVNTGNYTPYRVRYSSTTTVTCDLISWANTAGTPYLLFIDATGSEMFGHSTGSLNGDQFHILFQVPVVDWSE